VVSVDSPKKLLYISGQVSWNQKGETANLGDLEAQTKQAFREPSHSAQIARGLIRRYGQTEHLYDIAGETKNVLEGANGDHTKG